MVAASALGLGVTAVYVVLGALSLTVPQVGGLLPHFGRTVSAFVGAVPDPPHHARRARPPAHAHAAQVFLVASPPAAAAVPVARSSRPPARQSRQPP